MKRSVRVLALITVISCLSFLGSACKKSKKDTGNESASEISTSEITTTTTMTSTPTPTPEPTFTPTPTSSPTPSPTPTPVPEYVEPIIEGGAVWYEGYVDPRSVRAQIVEDPSDISVLVNKYYASPNWYVPELVYAKYSDSQQLRPEAAEAWEKMHDACMADIGGDLYLISGYRSWETQTYSFNNAITRRGLTKAVCKNAYPGRSEHPLGLGLDINVRSDPEIRDGFVETEVGKWVLEHGHEYGFIWRYPAGCGSITGYGVEGWHFRFVGVEVATYMYDNGIKTLEEYCGKPQLMPDDYNE